MNYLQKFSRVFKTITSREGQIKSLFDKKNLARIYFGSEEVLSKTITSKKLFYQTVNYNFSSLPKE